ncbi:MAG: glutamate synthase subunit beta [Actinobacteria bacterium]|nr:glutamate synthase subunit beta [Actinomycetota bacterium]MCL5445854.1 glutamate synthase subunit beta [Actinomycetota bacterium]
MGKITGFLEYSRQLPDRRPVAVRIRDWKEVYSSFPEERAREQAARCMDCGIPFCHDGCPLGNLIPEWNDLVYRGNWREAAERLQATHNFPEFTGRLCPAPCEAACVLGIAAEPVTIERMEYEIIEHAWAEGWVVPQPPESETSKSVAIVGSGPAGLACAQQLRRAGHRVVVYERAAKPGGLLRYGIPEFKMEKHVLDRRLEQLRVEGVEFVCNTIVGLHRDGTGTVPGDVAVDVSGQPAKVADDGGGSGVDDGKSTAGREASSTYAATTYAATIPSGAVSPAGADLVTSSISGLELMERYHAVVLAVGTGISRDLDIPGRDLDGIHLALDFLKPANQVAEGSLPASPVSADGRKVVILGGGDTGADCLGTAHRQGAESVKQLEIMPRPPDTRPAGTPWPMYPMIFRTTSAHEEGGEQYYSITTKEFLGDTEGRVRAINTEEVAMELQDGRPVFQPVPGTEREIECDMVLLALGFTGVEQTGIIGELGLDVTSRGTISVDSNWMTSTARVFACGDGARGQSLIVWATAEGRSAASAVDAYLSGGESLLPAPVAPGTLPIH